MSVLSEQYYNNPELWTNGTLTLKDIIDDIIIISNDQDSLFKDVSRYALSLIARNGLRDLNYAVKHSVRAVQFNVPSSLMMPVPEDYMNWVKVSLTDGCGNLTEIDFNSNVPAFVVAYLQNCGGEVMFDCSGDVFDMASELKCRHGYCVKDNNCPECRCYKCDCVDHKKGWFTVHEGFFQFSSELEDQEVFIEYASNGIEKLDDCSLRIKDGYKEALTNYIKWQYLLNKRNTQSSSTVFYELYILERNKLKKRGLEGTSVSLDKIIDISDMRF